MRDLHDPAMGAGMQATNASLLSRFRRLDGARRKLLAQAAWTVSAASAAVAFLPFRRAIRFGAVATAAGKARSAEDCVWAVEAAARRLPWRAMCIEKGLAVQRLLRRGGVDALLHYGVRRSGAKLEAHVWVTVDGRPVIGGSEAAGFAEVACYP